MSERNRPWDSSDVSMSSVEHCHPERIVEALRRGSIGFSFSGGGFLLPYFLGVIRFLLRIGMAKPGQTHVGGSSAGSLAAAVLSCGLSTDVVMAGVRRMAADCRYN